VKTGFASVNEKLTKLQESIYDLVRKTQAPQHAEEFRESLPDPPKKRSEFAR
jgi:2-iminoacetate synthase ThiH